MTSDVSYASINENFPVAGQDNDTQVFRDNFDSIKNGLRFAQTELSDILSNAAFLDEDNDFNNKTIQRAVLINSTESVRDLGSRSGAVEVDYETGNYQILILTGNTVFTISNLPSTTDTPDKLGRLTLELYSDGGSYTVSFQSVAGAVYKKNAGYPGSVTVASNINPVLIEVWRHSNDKIFLNYLGAFSS
jgi:hypothetical protein